MKWIKERLKEPSTYAGAGAVLGGASVLITQAGQTLATTGRVKTAAIAALLGLLGMFLPEGGSTR